MLDAIHTNHTRDEAPSGQAVPRMRKIRLDRSLYSSHSVRASGGDSDCDHDFETTPTTVETAFAIWKCTRCGREFKYEIWN
ncbi:MAG: hypothetical protein JO133_12450 [Burkholderiaceae bacterium]|nr:hypothetical protein [Burkholderiaceae bacterium]